MTKITKRVLFYSAVAMFLILSYVVILYAQGYKYNFSENRFFKTGAMYLKTNTDADIYVNDKFLGNTSFFGNSYKIKGLLPQRYTVRIQKNDYSVWQKLVIVDEGFVSEFSKVLLLPEDKKGREDLYKEIILLFPSPSSPLVDKPTPTPSPAPNSTEEKEEFTITKNVLYQNQRDTPGKSVKIADNIKGFILSPEKNRLAFWTANEVWVIWLKDTNYQPYHKKGDKDLITRFSTQIKKAAWFRDEDHLIIDSSGYKILEIDTRGGINIISVT